MSGLSRRPTAGRIIWTVVVAIYFLFFFWNLLHDALRQDTTLPVVFSFVLVLWLAVEYYFGSPFFQSGVWEHSALWRGVFAFFVYPFYGYCAADFIWWHRTQLPLPAVITGSLGLLVFAAGTWLRLATLFALVRIVQYRPVRQEKKQTVYELVVPERGFLGQRLQRLCRHPRYLGTLVQLVGAALFFRSWGGLVLAVGFGLPLVLLQARYEDSRLRTALRAEAENYFPAVPLLFPRFRS